MIFFTRCWTFRNRVPSSWIWRFLQPSLEQHNSIFLRSCQDILQQFSVKISYSYWYIGALCSGQQTQLFLTISLDTKSDIVNKTSVSSESKKHDILNEKLDIFAALQGQQNRVPSSWIWRFLQLCLEQQNSIFSRSCQDISQLVFL